MVVVGSGTNFFAKEMANRKRIAAVFNKREDDFPSLRAYNDYLEEVENMIVNLVEGIDVPAIETRILQYEKENAEQIMNAHARKAEEYAAALAASTGQPVRNDDDGEIGQQQSSQTGMSMQGHYAPAVAGGVIAQPRPTGLGGPQEMYIDDENMMRLKAERGGKAGGWSYELSKKRAIEEAFSTIWV